MYVLVFGTLEWKIETQIRCSAAFLGLHSARSRNRICEESPMHNCFCFFILPNDKVRLLLLLLLP